MVSKYQNEPLTFDLSVFSPSIQSLFWTHRPYILHVF